ncbi:MAG: carboxyl transferase domain-containing protein, partial [Aeromicrobium sp.]
AQLAGVISIVARGAAESKGQPYDEQGDTQMRAFIEEQIEKESLAYFTSGMLYDDGVIDPRDTRTILGICLSAINTRAVKGAEGYGVFRL